MAQNLLPLTTPCHRVLFPIWGQILLDVGVATRQIQCQWQQCKHYHASHHLLIWIQEISPGELRRQFYFCGQFVRCWNNQQSWLAVLSMAVLVVKLYNYPGSQAETIQLCSLRSLESCQMEQLGWLWSGRIPFLLLPGLGNHPVPHNYFFFKSFKQYSLVFYRVQ